MNLTSALESAFGTFGSTVKSVTSGLEQFFNQIKGFAAVLSPATIALFDQALANINATIGQSFLPLFEDLIQVLGQANRMIAPAFEALTPIVKEFSDALGSALLKYVRVLADQFQFLVPVIGSLLKVLDPLFQAFLIVAGVMGLFSKVAAAVAEVLLHFLPIGIILEALTVVLESFNGTIQILSEAVNIVTVVIEAASKVFQGIVGAVFPIKDVFADLNKTVQTVIKSMYVFAVQLSKMFGFDKAATAIVEYLEKKSTAEGKTAAQQTSLKGFEQLAKDIATRAAGAGAGGAGGIEDERAFWKEVTAAARASAAETLSFKDMVSTKFDELIAKIPGVDTMRKAEAAVASATGTSSRTVRGAAIGTMLGGPLGTIPGAIAGWGAEKVAGLFGG